MHNCDYILYRVVLIYDENDVKNYTWEIKKGENIFFTFLETFQFCDQSLFIQ